MIPVAKVPKPPGFVQRVQKPGEAWLAANPKARRPRDLWSPFLPKLEEGFASLCGYAAMLDPTGGTVDHYLSFRNHPDRAYDWSNYRFASHSMNASKRTADEAVLDPYLVGEGWFELLLPSLQLTLTDKVPRSERAKAEFTLVRLKLRDGEKVVRWRRHWYEMFLSGHLSLAGLREVAPLLADAVAKQRSGPKTSATKAKPRAKPRATTAKRGASARASQRSTRDRRR